NQYGYEPGARKRATLVTDETEPVEWAVRAPSGDVVASGASEVLGDDATAGLHVHRIDFSALTTAGSYLLAADGDHSAAFEVGDGSSQPLLIGALAYFYLARSGIAIDGDIVGEKYARTAGHVSDAAAGETNKGDLNVPCQPAEDSAKYYDEPWTGDY